MMRIKISWLSLICIALLSFGGEPVAKVYTAATIDKNIVTAQVVPE